MPKIFFVQAGKVLVLAGLMIGIFSCRQGRIPSGICAGMEQLYYHYLSEAAYEGDLNTLKALWNSRTPEQERDTAAQARVWKYAISGGHKDVVKYLLNRKWPVNYVVSSYLPPAWYAAENGQLEMLMWLIEAGASIAPLSGSDATPLHGAVRSGDRATVQYLLEQGKYDFESDDFRLYDFWKNVICHGDIELFCYLETYGVPFVSVGELSFWAEDAARTSDPELFRYLVEERSLGNGNYTRLLEIALCSHQATALDRVKYLVNKGGDLTRVYNGRLFPVVMEYGRSDMILYLLKQGYVFTEEEHSDGGPGEGWTLLASALDFGRFDVAAYLLESGAKTIFRGEPLIVYFADDVYNSSSVLDFLIWYGINREHYTEAFLKSVRYDHTKNVYYLARAGADIQAKSEEGLNALCYARSAGMAALLLDLGVDPTDSLSRMCFADHLVVMRAMDEKGLPLEISQERLHTGLLETALQGDLWMVEYFLRKGADVNYADPHTGRTALMMNAIQGYATYSTEAEGDDRVYQVSDAIARMLLRAGADPDLTDRSGRTALHYACEHTWRLEGPGPIVDGNTRQQIARGDHGDPGPPPFHYHDLIVELLVRAGADVNVTDNQGNTPLIIATGSGTLRAIGCLVEAGADVEISNRQGKTMFDLVRRVEEVRFLQDVGYAGRVPEKQLNQILRGLDKRDDKKIDIKDIAFLVEAGADINYPIYSDVYRTLLFLMVMDEWEEKRTHNVRRMVGLGANVHIRENGGATVLIRAVKKGCSVEVIELLLKEGVGINLKDTWGNTALFYVRTPELMRYLLEHGADPAIRNKRGETAYQYIKWRSQWNVGLELVVEEFEKRNLRR